MELTSKRSSVKKEEGGYGLPGQAFLLLAGFFISRVGFEGDMFPASIALLSVLLSIRMGNALVLPVMLLGLFTCYKAGAPVGGDAAALCGCTLIFFLTAKLGLDIRHRAVLAGAVTVISQSLFAMASGLTYRLSLSGLLFEGAVVAALCGIFYVFFQMTGKDSACKESASRLLALTTVVLLTISGMGFEWLVLPAAMIITLFFGYLLGAMEGLFAGFASGFLLLLCGGSSGITLLLALGGLTAGLFKGQSKAVTALCFAAAIMGTASLKTLTSDVLPDYAPLAAAAVLLFLPKKWLSLLESFLCSLLGYSSSRERAEAMYTAGRIDSLGRIFDELAALFEFQNDRRVLMSYQFKAVSQMLNRLKREPARSGKNGAADFHIRTAWAGEAGNHMVSGDSCMWGELPGNRFAAVISDGMGKGREAGKESRLAAAMVIRLLETGMEEETALQLLNEVMLLNAEKEMFSTIDLGVFHRKTGKMRFYKIGAAPTFIRRKNRVEMLTVPAMPMGIVNGLKADYVSAELRAGDEVIMISDGVMDSRREDLTMRWLKETIAAVPPQEPEIMCDAIVEQTLKNYKGKEKDDLTVFVFTVC